LLHFNIYVIKVNNIHVVYPLNVIWQVINIYNIKNDNITQDKTLWQVINIYNIKKDNITQDKTLWQVINIYNIKIDNITQDKILWQLINICNIKNGDITQDLNPSDSRLKWVHASLFRHHHLSNEGWVHAGLFRHHHLSNKVGSILARLLFTSLTPLLHITCC